MRGLVVGGGLVVAGCVGGAGSVAAQAPGSRELVIEVANETITMGGREVEDAAALQRALMHVSNFDAVVRVETRGPANDETLRAVLDEVTKAPAHRIELRLGELFLSAHSRLRRHAREQTATQIMGQVQDGKLQVSAGSQKLAEVSLGGDAAAEERARAAVDAACKSSACWGSFAIPRDVPQLATLAIWQRVVGDRNQSISIMPNIWSSTPTAQEKVEAEQKWGRLPPEVIQRIVREQFPKIRVCYEDGLSRNPELFGLIETRFVIDRKGAVKLVEDAGSNLQDFAVRDCVQKVFQTLAFPAPEGGIVAVVYPIMLQPN